MIGILGEQPAPTIVKNGFKGYPAGMPNDDTTGDEHFCQQRDVLLGRPEQAHAVRYVSERPGRRPGFEIGLLTAGLCQA